MNLSTRATLLLVLLAAGSVAQINEGTVLGSVRDATGAVLPASTIQVTNTATNVQSSTSSNSAGEYILTNWSPDAIRSPAHWPGSTAKCSRI